MYAMIVKNGSTYELQYKEELNSASSGYTEKSSSPELLKMSLTAEWEIGEGDILWIAKIG